MWPFISPINLIRYLFVWRVNSSLVWLPRCLSAEISLVLGTIIADRLPTHEARHWRKALASSGEYGEDMKEPKTVPPALGQVEGEALWPIEAVLFVYPGKRSYGRGELILWELKLMGDSADHGLFLEVILPAMEEAATTSDPRWHYLNSPWGRFDIHSVYVARGSHWEPIVQEGKLDLHYHASPVQWAEGLTFDAGAERVFDRLTWLTPFDLSERKMSSLRRKRIPSCEVPTLQMILESLIVRMSLLLPGKHNTPDDVWNSLDAEERSSLRATVEQAATIPVHHHVIRRAPRNWPGRWIGTQTFPSIPSSIVPYLELASILHIGRQTHFGCGTFAIA